MNFYINFIIKCSTRTNTTMIRKYQYIIWTHSGKIWITKNKNYENKYIPANVIVGYGAVVKVVGRAIVPSGISAFPPWISALPARTSAFPTGVLVLPSRFPGTSGDVVILPARGTGVAAGHGQEGAQGENCLTCLGKCRVLLVQFRKTDWLFFFFF